MRYTWRPDSALHNNEYMGICCVTYVYLYVNIFDIHYWSAELARTRESMKPYSLSPLQAHPPWYFFIYMLDIYVFLYHSSHVQIDVARQ